MWELYLTWLPAFSWILVGTMLTLGIMLAVTRSLKHIYGRWNDGVFGYEEAGKHLFQLNGFIPLILLEGGVFSIIGGTICLVFVHYAKVPEADVMAGISLGGLIGVCHVGFVKGINWLFETRTMKIAGGTVIIVGSFIGGMTGGISGLIVGGIASLFVVMVFAKKFDDDDITGLIPGSAWIAAGVAGWIAGSLVITGWLASIAFGVIFGVLTSMMASTIAALVLFLNRVLIERYLFSLFSSFLISQRFRTIICGHCLRYTHRFRSTYWTGIRYCEHCQHEVELTKAPGKVIVTLDQFPLKTEGRTFILSDSELERSPQSIDITDVYFDTATCNPMSLERLLTHLMNYPPPTHGIEAIQVFYQGELDDLVSHVKNALQNNFKCVKRLPEVT